MLIGDGRGGRAWATTKALVTRPDTVLGTYNHPRSSTTTYR